MSDVQIAVIDQQDTQIVLAVPGVQGATGSSIPSGGTTDQVLRKNSSTNYDAGWTQVTSAMIADGAIVNADVNNGAAIAGTKISPDFGGQTVTTTGQVNAARVNVTANTAPTNGIYLPSANNVAISTGGSGRLFVDASGRVGIGATPSFGLDLQGTGQVVERIQSTSTSGLSLGSFLVAGGNGAVNYQIDVDGTGNNFGPGVLVGTTTNHYTAFRTNNTERLRITSAGLVGIGTSTPGQALDVVGTIQATASTATGFNRVFDTNGITTGRAQLRLQNSGGGLQLGVEDSTGGSTLSGSAANSAYAGSNSNTPFYLTQNATIRATIDTSGRLGIGSTSPQGQCESATGGDTYCFVANNTFGGTLQKYLSLNSGSTQLGNISRLNSGNDIGFNATYGALTFGTGASGTATEKARIDSSGRLLVGTSSSTGNIREGQLFSVTAQNSGYGGMSLGCYNSGAVAPILDFNTSASSSSGSYAAVASGRLLGTIVFRGADGTQFLEGASISAVADGGVSTNDLPTRLVFSTTADGASSPTERMRIVSGGALIVNATALAINSNSKFYVSGISEFVAPSGSYVQHVATAGTGNQNLVQFARSSGSVEVGKITTDGTSTTYGTTSDYRLKENITLVSNGITRLQQLKPCRFNFKTDPDRTVDGFIAHEVQEVVSEAVTGEKDQVDADGKPIYQAIDQSKLVPLLTAALQEAIGEIESLKARVAALEAN